MSEGRKVWDFKKQLELGSRGEQLMLKHFHKKLEVFPEHAYDFTCGDKKVELKTDDYNFHKSENFFIERWSDVYQQKPGGPWQSLGKGVDWFIYYFVRHDRYFLFDNLQELVQRVEDILTAKRQGLIYIKNKAWITAGYKIRRELLADLYQEYTFDSSRDDVATLVSKPAAFTGDGTKD